MIIIFFIWPHTRQELDSFLTDLNRIKTRIRFSAEVNTQSCNFLDLTIYKSPTFPTTGILSTKIYYKETNTMSFPLGSSYTPRHVLRSIAIGETIRLLRNTDSPVLYRHYKRKLFKQLKKRQYPKNILRDVAKISHKERWVRLYKYKRGSYFERPLPFKTMYAKYKPSLNSIFRRRWELIYNDNHLYNLLPNPPNTVYRNRKALKPILSAKRRNFKTHTA